MTAILHRVCFVCMVTMQTKIHFRAWKQHPVCLYDSCRACRHFTLQLIGVYCSVEPFTGMPQAGHVLSLWHCTYCSQVFWAVSVQADVMQAAVDQMRPLLHDGVDVSSLQPSVIQAISLKTSIMLYNPCAFQKLVNVSIEDGASPAAQIPDYHAILV